MPKQTGFQGVLFALAAYTMWGIAPIYFKSLGQVPAQEILVHRIIWSCLLLAILLTIGKQWHAVRQVFQAPKQLKTLFLTSLLIASNWLIFIWAVNNDRMLDASLGYFINPLFNIVLALLFLGERFRRNQWIAIALAAFGVMLQVYNYGTLPIITLSLAISFGLYGLLRKKVHLAALPGLFIETLVLLPLALIYWFFFVDSSTSSLANNSLQLNGLLMSAGIVTTLPLLCFTAAATRLRLSTLGFFQYIGPSLMFTLAVTYYGEALDPEKLTTFIFIWCALALYSIDAVIHQRRNSNK